MSALLGALAVIYGASLMVAASGPNGLTVLPEPDELTDVELSDHSAGPAHARERDSEALDRSTSAAGLRIV